MASNTESIIWHEHNQVQWVGIRPGYIGDQVTAYDSGANVVKVLYTVPDGKVLLIFQSAIYIYETAAVSGNATLYIRDGGDAKIHEIEKVGARNGGAVANSHSRFSPLVVLAGYDICCVSGSASTGIGAQIEGILVTP